MKIAVLSGKGGTGKTFISVNLASVIQNSIYADCDVEEPNGHLFFKPSDVITENVTKLFPFIDNNKCNNCRSCINFCKFNALASIKEKITVFKEVCHSCGGCSIVCPKNAILEKPILIGQINIGKHNTTTIMTGMLNIGEASGTTLIKKLLDKSKLDKTTIIDCPPGSACTTMESIYDADYCIIVAEPTTFGVHNFEMIHELVTLLGKPFGIIINKYENANNLMEKLCAEKKLNILSRIPYNNIIAKLTSEGQIAVEVDIDMKNIFKKIYEKIMLEVDI